jgi:hypothetical protein
LSFSLSLSLSLSSSSSSSSSSYIQQMSNDGSEIFETYQKEYNTLYDSIQDKLKNAIPNAAAGEFFFYYNTSVLDTCFGGRIPFLMLGTKAIKPKRNSTAKGNGIWICV